MNQDAFDREMKVAEVHGEDSKERGLNWVIMSFAAIILVIIIGLLGASMLSSSVAPKMINNTNTEATPIR